MIRERQGVSFTPEEQEIFETVFQGFSPVEFMKLLRIGKWRDIVENEILVREGDCVEEVIFIYNGEASISSKGKVINSLRDGAFIGEMEFLSKMEATATVKTNSPLRCVIWATDDLKQLLVRNPCMYSAIQTTFSADLVKKLQTTV
jgi:CRP-like cAMP-binding protein